MPSERKFKPIDPEKFRACAEAFKRKEISAEQAADTLGISRCNFFDRLRVAGYTDPQKYKKGPVARRPGVKYGPPFKILDPVIFSQQVELYHNGKTSLTKAGAALGITAVTFRERYNKQISPAS